MYHTQNVAVAVPAITVSFVVTVVCSLLSVIALEPKRSRKWLDWTHGGAVVNTKVTPEAVPLEKNWGEMA